MIHIDDLLEQVQVYRNASIRNIRDQGGFIRSESAYIQAMEEPTKVLKDFFAEYGIELDWKERN